NANETVRPSFPFAQCFGLLNFFLDQKNIWANFPCSDHASVQRKRVVIVSLLSYSIGISWIVYGTSVRKSEEGNSNAQRTRVLRSKAGGATAILLFICGPRHLRQACYCGNPGPREGESGFRGQTSTACCWCEMQLPRTASTTQGVFQNRC